LEALERSSAKEGKSSTEDRDEFQKDKTCRHTNKGKKLRSKEYKTPLQKLTFLW
jgi:hypothetical protein